MQLELMLIKACQNGQKGIVDVYLKKGINVNRVDDGGFSALHYACNKGSRDIVKMLLDHDADVTIANNKGATPLHYAVSNGNKDIIKMLLDNGADINATDNKGESVVIYAIKAGKGEAVKYLKDFGADMMLADNDGRNAIDHAGALGLTGLIGDVIDTVEQSADSYGNTALHQACYNGHSETVNTLLKNPDINIDAVNDAGETPLYIAINSDNPYIAEILIKAGSDVNRKTFSGENLIHIAARHRKHHMVNVLIENGADVNVKNKNGETPLLCAIKSTDGQRPSMDITELLLEYKADVTCRDMWGKTALYYATNHKNSRIIELLLNAGAEE